MSRNGVIGHAGGLPWRLPDDLRHFKALTQGKRVVMGRATYQGLPGGLPGREIVVLSRSYAGGAQTFVPVAGSVRDVTALPHPVAGEVIIAGGAQVYAAFWPLVTRLHLTVVDAVLAGDTYFPEPPGRWDLVAREDRAPDERHAYGRSFLTFERRPLAP